METATCRLVLLCVVAMLADVQASQNIMAQMSKGFLSVLKSCVSELGVDENVYKDFSNFWNEDYELVNRDMGCIIMCMVSKLDLLGDDDKIHHANAHEFAKQHGADDEVAKQVVSLLHECEKAHSPDNDPCNQALQIAKCFRTKIHELKWAPNIEVILEEIMTDIKT